MVPTRSRPVPHSQEPNCLYPAHAFQMPDKRDAEAEPAFERLCHTKGSNYWPAIRNPWCLANDAGLPFCRCGSWSTYRASSDGRNLQNNARQDIEQEADPVGQAGPLPGFKYSALQGYHFARPVAVYSAIELLGAPACQCQPRKLEPSTRVIKSGFLIANTW